MQQGVFLQFTVLWTLLVASIADSSFATGLIKTETELVEALAFKSRVVLGSSIAITKELPPITRPVTIVGHAKACKQKSCYIDAQHKSRHVTVLGDGSLSVYNLELRNGKFVDDDGGSILVKDGGVLETNGAVFTNNNVAMFSVGGAVSVRNGSSANIYKSTFVQNSAGFGGAIGVSENSKADIRSSNFQHNYATLSGGGLEFLARSSALLVDNAYENNTASIGGASTAHDSSLSICGATFTRNTGNLDGPNIMSEGNSSITVCRASKSDVAGPSPVEDCAPCSALGPLPGVRGDPHIRGPHGETFDFHGIPEKTYCLISDQDLHLNMRTMAGNTNNSTYIRELGLIYLNQTVWVSSLSSTNKTEHQGSLLVNTKEMPMESTTWSFPSTLVVSRTRNEVIVEVRNRFRMSFKVVKVVHKSRSTARSNFLNLRIAYFNPTKAVDGIFGQLYRPSSEKAMQFQGSGKFKSLVDSESYRVSGILAEDFKRVVIDNQQHKRK